MTASETAELRQRLNELRLEHQDLDAAVSALQQHPYIDSLQLRRLKKRKLQLKDMIQHVESELIPDLNA